MPNPYLLTFELLLYGLLLFSARHAWRSGGLPTLWQLAASVAFGVLLEWATINQLHAYAYGRFLIMFGEVPLAIGVGWGVIIYSAQCFSNATSLPPMLRPVLDGLLALNIDMAMDAVAIRLGMWQWGIDLSAQYFGGTLRKLLGLVLGRRLLLGRCAILGVSRRLVGSMARAGCWRPLRPHRCAQHKHADRKRYSEEPLRVERRCRPRDSPRPRYSVETSCR